VTCQNCFQVGHNKKGCKAPPVQKPIIENKKARRPRKADAADVGGSANPLGGSANPLGGFANPLGRSATGVGRSGVGRSAIGMGRSGVGRSGVGRSGVGRSATGVGWSGVGRSATGVGTNATGLGRSGSGVGRSESGMGVNATGLGRYATLIDDEGVNESTNQHDDGIDVGGSTIVFVGPASDVGGSVQGTGGSGIGKGVVRGCDIPRWFVNDDSGGVSYDMDVDTQGNQTSSQAISSDQGSQTEVEIPTQEMPSQATNDVSP
ncbi:hypothetical protein Tco_0960284, partial [Tanacetum coccineum]